MIAFAKIYFLIFGLLTLAGGIMGYVKANSVASLIAGGLSGILLMAGAWMMDSSARPILMGLGLISLVLAIRFVPAFINTMKVMPAGLMAGLSVVGVVLAAWALFAPGK
jgi:uncharacterized membrane protein (UPF0136 family)